jgi:23S rRNA (guanosine2251-2'-O)-methyltransferase
LKRRLCGTHAVAEALAARPRAIALLMVADDGPRSPHRDAIERAKQSGVLVEVRTANELDAIAKGVKHQGIIAIGGEDFAYYDLDGVLREASQPELLVALDEITDVHNFGAIVRSCVALGADGVITLRDRAAPVNAAVVRASAGATEHARIARVTNLSRALEQLDERAIQSVGLDMDGDRTLDAVDFTMPTVIVVGSEGKGLRRLVRERCTMLARIPMAGPLGSLNASVAAAIALYEARRQRLSTAE